MPSGHSASRGKDLMATKETLTAAQKEFEESLQGTKYHINTQTFGADASAPIYETIDTPGVDIAGKVGCLIMMVACYIPAIGAAAATLWSKLRHQIAMGTQTGFIAPTSNKYLGERLQITGASAAGVCPAFTFPFSYNNPIRPMIVVDPKMTIIIEGDNVADINSKDVVTVFSYVNVELSLELHTSMLNAQMNLT